MPGIPNRRPPPPPNVTMGQCSGNFMMTNRHSSQWMVNNNNSGVWNGVGTTAPAAPLPPPLQPVQVAAGVRPQAFDVIARRRNPHWGVGGHTLSPPPPPPPPPPAAPGGSPLTPTPTPSPATPSPISPAYPNRPLSVLILANDWVIYYSFILFDGLFCLNLILPRIIFLFRKTKFYFIKNIFTIEGYLYLFHLHFCILCNVSNILFYN